MILLGGKSLSKLGKDLDGQKYYHKEQQPSTTRRNLQKRINRQFIKIHQEKKKPNPTFNTVSREVKSSFIIKNSKDSFQNNYTPQYNVVKPHSYECQISKTLTKHPFDPIKNYSSTTLCRKHPICEEQQQKNKNNYKSLHHLDFNKQSPRKLHQQSKGSLLDSQLRFNNYQSLSLDKRRSRSFSSYTKRRQLFDKVAHPLMINLRQCKSHLFKKGWSPQKIVPFNKLVDKVKLRSDKIITERPSQYNNMYEEDVHTQAYTQRPTFTSQTSRKPNLVKSQYHFRICL